MENISLILYIIGIAGICLCIILLGTKFHKKNKFFSFITLLFIFISVISLGFGTITQFIEKKNNILANVTNDNAISDNKITEKVEEEQNKDKSSKEDLLFKYTLKNNKFNILITNNSDEVFNGVVHINQNSKVTDLPIHNLTPKGTSKYTIVSTDSTELLNYEFDGSFSKELNSNIPYSISTMSTGNGYIRFEVVSQNKDLATLSSICKSFKNMYTTNHCQGFLIYFIDSNNDNLDKSYADYYCNNIGTSSILTLYSDNTTVNIN